jgi:siroheme synthase (precorrin-2 oxidase/ferrochelatase)
MRTNLTNSPADHIVLVGTGEAALAALWRLCAAGARIRWFADRADVGEETVLAHALGGGQIELRFDDPLAASLDGTAALVIPRDGSCDPRLAERARASGVPVHFVGRPDLAGVTLADLDRAALQAQRPTVSTAV